MSDFFALVNGASRFWLPAVLNEVAKIPPSLCRGDGCSIFLLWGEGEERRLHLAATTRSERLHELFDERSSYLVDPEALRLAAKVWKSDRHISRDASLTGWVAAFARPMRIANLHDATELNRLESPDAPRPVWSEKSRGPQDHNPQIPRPLLCVPMMAGGQLLGAIRVATTGRSPHTFDASDQDRLSEFANSLAALLVECGAIERPGLPHFFRIWGAEDVDELGQRITKAVPALFDVECCSIFLRDPSRRFVLRTGGTSREGDETFQQFIDQNRDELYYEKGDGSKTSLCIDHQRPVALVRGMNSPWRISSEDGALIDHRELRAESGGKYKSGKTPTVRCEFDHATTRSILLVPVIDQLSTYLPAGVLRVLSTREILDHQTVIAELRSFAQDLSGVIGKAWQSDQHQRARDELFIELTNSRLSLDQKIAKAARIACGAVEAGAVTIFVRDRRAEDARLVTKSEYSVLSDKFLGTRDDLVDHHERFSRELPTYLLGDGGSEGRSAWVARVGRALNLKDSDDMNELQRLGLRPEPGGMCELPEVGPFLAVPVSIGPNQRVDGVIRAVRRRGSLHGSFSVAHEEILGACGNTLATLLRALRWTAVVSYATDTPRHGNGLTTQEVVRGWLERAGGEPLWVTDRVELNPLKQFRELCEKADIGIVIATGNEGPISASVEDETQVMWQDERLMKRRIILEMKDVLWRKPEVKEGAHVVTYPRDPAGIFSVHEEFDKALGALLGDRAQGFGTRRGVGSDGGR